MHSSSFKNTLLILFVRAPRPGSVKTRIAATAGPEVTLNIYRDMVGTLIHNLQDLPDVELRFTPDDGLEEITPWLQPGWTARTQGSGDLGARMENAFSEAFQSGFNKVALIGSDCPGIHRQDIQTAWSELDEKDLVLGPAADGGYWLIAMNRLHPSLFDEIPWSTSLVLDQTLERAKNARLRHRLLGTRVDIDTEADWRAYRPHPAPHRS